MEKEIGKPQDGKVETVTTLFSVEDEDSKLRQLGIHRELKKEFTNFTTLSFAIGILGYGSNLHSGVITRVVR